ncbi:SusC/RagA family TonB-linked outer membrane protein [Candidatus Palauibacter sp.]|uniref:SusC/RagA family TonB-linked outer membrane protein n=1 Tax=Candidatus Palauibacter sp. TaxID=3101350 RepID=UPI003B028D3E
MKRIGFRTIGAWGAAAVALACLAPGLSGQGAGSIAGRVTEEGSLRPLSSVQVFIEGIGVGTFTNASGDFVLLNVPVGEQTVVARLVGYREASETVTVAAGETLTLDFALNVTAVQMDEIVVTGTGVATEKRKLGHTIATLNTAELENAPISDFSQLIAGREPGVVALPSSGYTGEGARIRIRGSASLSQLNEPIVYVDGIRVDRSAVQSFNGQGSPSRLDDIPPESIERVEIAKGAAAATLYGTEASNGVIQIFTKRGSAGAPRFTFRTDLTAISVPTNRILPVADFAGRVCSSPGCTGEGDAQRLADAVNVMSTRWGQPVSPWDPVERDLIPDLLTTGFGQTYSGSLQGGSSVFQYFASGRLATEDGPYDAARNFEAVEGLDPENDTNRRASLHTNFTLIPSSDLRIGVTTLYSDMEHHTPDNSNNIYGVFSSALMSQLRLANADPELGQINYYGQPAFATLRENAYQLNFVNSQHFAGSTNIDFSPSDAFTLAGTFGIDFTSDDAVSFRPYRWNVDGFSGSTPDGNRNVNENRSREITADIRGSYLFNTDRLENTLLFGGQGFLRQAQSAGGSGRDFPGPGLETLSALGSESSFENWLRVTQIGGYVQDQIGWDNWLFLTVGARWDANSAFGEAFNTALYPKANFAIVPSERWDSELFSSMRIKGAYGTSGLQPGAFDKFTTFSSLGTEVGPGVQPSNLGNEQLKPEVSTELEFGIDLGLFNDRWSVEATWWDRVVTDAMVARQFPVTGGFTQTQLDNIGEVTARGLELGIRGNLIQARDISLNVFANTAFLSEEITDMGGAPPLKTGGSYPRYRNYLVEGFTPGAFFGAQVADVAIPLNILDPVDGQCVVPTRDQALAYFSQPRNPNSFKPLAIGNEDFGTPNGELASHNCGTGLLDTHLGNPTPDYAGSFGFDLAFLGNFQLTSLMEYKIGHQVQDLSGMFRRANNFIGRNTPRSAELYSAMLNPGSTAEQRLDAAVAWAHEVEGLSPMSGMNGVYDADSIHWRELSLSYRVPSSVIERWGFSAATVNMGVRNLMLFMLGDYPGMDPEGNVLGRCNGGLNCNFLNSTEGWGIPIPRRFTMSVRLTL